MTELRSGEHLTERLDHHLRELEAWASGARSWTNTYHPDAALVAVLDAQEVVKHSAAVQAYAVMIAMLHPQGSEVR